MDIQQKQLQVEAELVTLIIAHLKNNRIDIYTASRLAKDFLRVLPIRSQEDLLGKLKSLGDTYAEVKQVYVLEVSKDKRQKEQHALQRMSTSIQQGNIEHAISVAKSLQNQQQ